MKAGELTTGPAKLNKAWQKLSARWDATQLEWNDVVAREFEENYLDKLKPQLLATIERMQALAVLFTAASQESQRYEQR